MLHRAPLLWALGPLVAGMLLSAQEMTPPAEVLALTGLCAGGAAVLLARSAPRLGLSLLCAAWLCTGAIRYQATRASQPEWTSLPARELTLDLKAESLLDADAESARGFARIERSDVPFRDLEGARIWFTARAPGVAILPGDTARVRGVLRPLAPPSLAQDFDLHLASSGAVFALERGRILSVRRTEGFSLRRLGLELNHAMAGLLRTGLEARPDLAAAYLALKLGTRTALEPERREAYRRTGTLHLFAISGMNIGVIAVCIHVLARLLRLGERPASAAGALGAAVFVLATGASPSSLRALLMLLSVYAARWLLVHSTALAQWCLAALLTLLLDPCALFSSGFQLSFLVVLGLLVHAAPLDTQLARARPPALVPSPDPRLWLIAVSKCAALARAGACASFSATLFSLPICVTQFGGFSTGALLGNLLLIPLASLVVLSGLASLLLGLAGLTAAGALCNHSAALALVLMDTLSRALARLPGIYWTADWRFDGAGLLLTAALVAAALAGTYRRWRPAVWLLLPPAIVILGLAALAKVSPG